VAAEWKKYGGPQQYLLAVLPTEDRKREFAQWLTSNVPREATATYQDKHPLPHCASGAEDKCQAFYIHISKFAFDETASARQAPGLALSLDLLNHYVLDGFLTGIEPVIVSFEAGRACCEQLSFND
jgi:hypothetical protein